MADDFVELDVSPEQLAQLDKSGIKYESLSGSQSAPSQEQKVHDYLPPETSAPKIGLGQGLGNLYNAGKNALGDVWNAGVNPQTYSNLAGQAGQAAQTQLGSFVKAPFEHRDPLLDAQLAATSKGYDAAKSIAEGVYNFPGAVTNAYNGNQAVAPTQLLPNSTEITGIGHALKEAQDRNPVAGFAGEQVPLVLAEALTAGTATPAVAGAKTANLLGRTAKAARVGAAYGLLGTPGTLEERAHAALGNAALGTALHLGGEGLGLLGKDTTADVGLNKIRESAEPQGSEQMVKDPATGLLTPTKPEIHTDSANMPEAGPGVLTGRVSNTDPVEGEWAPVNTEPPTEAEAAATIQAQQQQQAPLSPETGQPVPQGQVSVANQNHEDFSPDGAGIDQTQSAVEALRQRVLKNRMQAVANENHESFGAEPGRAQQAESQSQAFHEPLSLDLATPTPALEAIRRRQQQLHAVANENHEAYGPSWQQDQGSASAVEQLQARRQVLAQQQAEQAIQAKADELHGKLTNFERMGAKPQAAKLKAEIAEQAATHQDPIQRQAYQRALDKYAPPKTEVPKQKLPMLEEKPVEQPTVKLKGQVSKIEEIPNEPQRQVSNPEGQQPTQGQEKAAPVAEQKPVEPTEGEETLKGVAKGGATESPYVPTSNGETDLGRLRPEHNTEAKLPDVPVRMHEGNDKYGAIKIRDKHGVENPADFTQNVLKNYNYAKIDKENNSLILAIKNGKPQISAVELVLDPSGSYYSVKTAGEFGQNYLKNKKPDWEAAQLASVDTKQSTSGVDESPAKLGETATERKDQSGKSKDSTSENESLPPAEPLKASATKTQEVDQEALDELFPDSKKKSEAPPESPLDKKTQGTYTRGHLLEEAPRESGDFHLPHEIERKPEFLKAYSRYTPEQQTKLVAISDAIERDGGKKTLQRHYNPGTKTPEGVLTKRSGHADELYSPKGLSVGTPYGVTVGEEVSYKGKPYTVEEVLKPQVQINGKWRQATKDYQVGDDFTYPTKKGNITAKVEDVRPKQVKIGDHTVKPADLDPSIYVHGYNENSEWSTRKLERFNGEVSVTTERGYKGPIEHPMKISEGENFHPNESVIEQVSGPIQKKQTLGQPINELDYRAASDKFKSLVKEMNPQYQTVDNIEAMLKQLPDKVQEYAKKNPKGPC